MLTTLAEMPDTFNDLRDTFSGEMVMTDNDYLRQTLEHYRTKKITLLEELRKTEAFIEQFELELGEAPSGAESVALSAPNFPVVEARSSELRPIQIRPDEFYGMTQTQAAKAYLLRVKRAVSLDQIVEALRNGGAQLGGADPKKTLYVSLARNPQKEFVVPREGFFGLREFYPSLPKATAKPKNTLRGKKPKRKLAGKVSEAKKVQPTKPIDARPVRDAVHKVLSDGRAKTLDEIAHDAESLLGRMIAKLGIAATLRGHEFVKEGDKYRLVS